MQVYYENEKSTELALPALRPILPPHIALSDSITIMPNLSSIHESQAVHEQLWFTSPSQHHFLYPKALLATPSLCIPFELQTARVQGK
jgi:hypothetical protein